jgi:hypothetical protein
MGYRLDDQRLIPVYFTVYRPALGLTQTPMGITGSFSRGKVAGV